MADFHADLAVQDLESQLLRDRDFGWAMAKYVVAGKPVLRALKDRAGVEVSPTGVRFWGVLIVERCDCGYCAHSFRKDYAVPTYMFEVRY